jgi:hypothetical protein
MSTEYTNTYRGWTVSKCFEARCFEATSPDYEPTWVGGEDGWQDDYANRVSADTFADLCAEIDAAIDGED